MNTHASKTLQDLMNTAVGTREYNTAHVPGPLNGRQFDLCCYFLAPVGPYSNNYYPRSRMTIKGPVARIEKWCPAEPIAPRIRLTITSDPSR
jgi:hypothetical protein